MIWTTILATLLHTQLWSGDAQEDPAERASRLQTVAIAIAGASASKEEAAFLITLGELETHWARYAMHPSTCVQGARGIRCDNGKAYGYWSLHKQACQALWELPPGDERAVYLGAQCAVALMRYAKFACKAPEGVWNLYAGKRCSDPWGKSRMQRLRQVRSMLDHSGSPWPAEPPKP